MDDATKLAWLNRWLLLVFPSYLRYMAMLDRNRVWIDRFPLDARMLMTRLLKEQTDFCQRLADRVDSLNGQPEISQFPEDAARLNYLEMSVAIKKTIDRLVYNVRALESDRADVSRDPELAEVLEDGIEILNRHILELRPLSAEFSPSHD